MTQPPWLERREIGPCTLFLGDCLAIMPTIAPVDAVMTDPPYCSGGAYRGDRLMSCAAKYQQHGQVNGRNEFRHDAKDQRAFTSWCAEWVGRLPIPDGGYFLSFIDWRNLPALTDAVQWAGLIWRGVCPWDKGLGSRAPHKGYARHQAEYVVWATRGECRIATHGGPHPGVYRHTVKQSDKFHMAGKPSALMAELCQWVPNGATILDPFMGSGTTGVACLQTGRRFVGIEIDPTHYATACDRIERALAASVDPAAP
ncbi:MAG: site-specific DNA-methyltransferase [Thiobacillaceae bacterium]|jgi:site-specific DNA-methyltransferase (adenine-specific)|nr:site-specific DNA-methyltransferase [Thiobacillaceae bacterium]